MDDFRIPATPLMASHASPFAVGREAASVDLAGLGLPSSTPSRERHRQRPRLQVVPVTSDDSPDSGPSARLGTEQDRAGPASYFSSLTQKFQHQHPRLSAQTQASGSPSQRRAPVARLSGEIISHADLVASPFQRNELLDHHQQQQQQQLHGSLADAGAGAVDAGYRGIQEAIATKFQGLEKQIQSQEQAMTELQFSLNDAHVATDTLEAEKRQLKQKTDDLERRLRQRDSKASQLQDELRQCREALRTATDARAALQQEVETARQQSIAEQKAQSSARDHAEKAAEEANVKIRALQKEMQDAAAAASEQKRREAAIAEERMVDLDRQLQLRETELQTQKDAFNRLSKQLDDIPEKNFQALTACVKKIFERLAASRSDALADGEEIKKQSQEQHNAAVHAIHELAATFQQTAETLASFQREGNQHLLQLREKVDMAEAERQSKESCWGSELEGSMQGMQKAMKEHQAALLEKMAAKAREADVLDGICEKREKDCGKLSKMLLQQTQQSEDQLREIRDLRSLLQKLQETPREAPEMVAKIRLLEQQKEGLATEARAKEAQVAKLEESYKERNASLVAVAEKFASEVQQLSNTFHQREEDYRRALDQAADLAQKEAKRSLDENKHETQRELQQERAKRQSLEKELRQAKQDLSVMEENRRRACQALDAVQKDLAATKFSNQAVTEHLEDKVRALESQLDHSGAAMAKLKAALAEKEMDYADLRSSMEAYDEKVRILIEHLRGWAQDYTHIGAIRSRLEMLGQIDRSCEATARIREAEQIDSVLAQLRQYYARQATGACVAESDDSHEQRISDLSAFLEAEAAGGPVPAGRASKDEACVGKAAWYTGVIPSIEPLKTPGHGLQTSSSAVRPPPVVKERTIHMPLDRSSGGAPSSSPMPSSPVPRRRRQTTRAVGETTRSSKRKRTTAGPEAPRRQGTDTFAYRGKDKEGNHGTVEIKTEDG